LWNATRTRHFYTMMLRLRCYFFTLPVLLHRVAHSRTDHAVMHTAAIKIDINRYFL